MACPKCSVAEDHDHYVCPEDGYPGDGDPVTVPGKCPNGHELEVRPCVCDDESCVCA